MHSKPAQRYTKRYFILRSHYFTRCHTNIQDKVLYRNVTRNSKKRFGDINLNQEAQKRAVRNKQRRPQNADVLIRPSVNIETTR